MQEGEIDRAINVCWLTVIAQTFRRRAYFYVLLALPHNR